MNTDGQAVLAAENISVRIGGQNILQEVSFTAKAGEFVGIIGPNGAGKSTLLRSLRGLWPVAAGAAKVNGRLVASLGDKELARQIAYMQQEVNIRFGFTALEVVLAGRYPYLRWWENEREEDRRIAEKYMAFTGVRHLAGKSVERVSGGERQRILLAKVLAQETPLIFLDEPTASLDMVYQEEIFRYCQAVCRQGKTALLVAHDIRLAAKFCSRLILLAGGRIVADGAPEQVITSLNLERAYGLHAAVFTNKVTGHLDIHTYDAGGAFPPEKTVHIIGGGGSAGELIRALYEKGYSLSGGVFHQGDTDADAAAAFQVDYLAAPAFGGIDEQLAERNRAKIACADRVILANLYYGEQNLANLEAAFGAARLTVIEDNDIAGRDFTGGRAAELYRRLVALPQVTVMTAAEFMLSLRNDDSGQRQGKKDR